MSAELTQRVLPPASEAAIRCPKHSQPYHPVLIEPVSDSRLLKNGNFCGEGRRLFADPRRGCRFLPSERLLQNTKIPVQCRDFAQKLTTILGRVSAWLGREGSNLRMAESKSAALPLGYAPTVSGDRRGEPANSLGRSRSIGRSVAFQQSGAANCSASVPPCATLYDRADAFHIRPRVRPLPAIETLAVS